jgi:hypothetical protein
MSIFAKKPDWDTRVPDVAAGPPAPTPMPTPTAAKASPRFGIADAIALLRGLPADEKGELVVRVMRATLASVDVHLPEIIADATRRQKSASERIAAIHAQMAELEKQLESHRREIGTLEADLKETTTVKDRLQHAEKTAGLASGPARVGAPASSSQTPTPEPTVRTTHESLKS